MSIERYTTVLGCNYNWFLSEYYKQPLVGASLYDGKYSRGVMSLYAHLDEDELVKVLDFCIENVMSLEPFGYGFRKVVNRDNLEETYNRILLFNEVPRLSVIVEELWENTYLIRIGLHRLINTNQGVYREILAKLKSGQWRGLMSEKTWKTIEESKWLDEL